MELTALVWSLLAIVSCQTVSAMFNSCTNGDACIDIRQCDLFGPHYNEPAKWSTNLKHDFRSRVCQRESSNGVNMYKVCCPLDERARKRLDTTVLPMLKSCTNGDACVGIRQCDRFAPYHNEPSKWSASLKEEFRARMCQRKSTNGGVNMYKVCCPLADRWKRKLDLLDLEHCGAYSDNRIAYGNKAQLFQFPWMALLRSGGEWICGGTLINERYVLTAAHCVWRTPIEFVRLGEFDLDKTTDCDMRGEVCAPAPQDIHVQRQIMHEDYSARRKQNDIALIRLAQPATANDNVIPICLPVTPDLQPNFSNYVVAGWGSTENAVSSSVLRYTALSLVAQDECLTRLQEIDRYAKIFDTQMCAIGVKNLSDNCVGDSGGPLKSISVNARYVQYGVVSFGLKSCGRKVAPGVYARVESYIDWILDKLEE